MQCGQPRPHDYHAVPFGGVEEMPSETFPRAAATGIDAARSFESSLIGWRRLSKWIRLEEVSVFVVGVLVGRDNIAAEA